MSSVIIRFLILATFARNLFASRTHNNAHAHATKSETGFAVNGSEPENHLIQGKKYEKQLNRNNREVYAAFMRGAVQLQSVHNFPIESDEDAQLAFITANARHLLADRTIDRKEWLKLWQQEPEADDGALKQPECDLYHSKKRLMINFGMSESKASTESKKLCRFGKTATVFIWHSNGPNVGHVAMLLGPPDAARKDPKWYNMHMNGKDEYTPGIGPHKAFSGCRNKPSSWRLGNCYSYVSWWPAAPGVQGYFDTYDASMHDFNSDQEAEGTLPEYIPIDTLNPKELTRALEHFARMRNNPDKTYVLLKENCAVSVAKVLADGACDCPTCRENTAVWKDATGNLAIDLAYKGCKEVKSERTISIADKFAPW